MNRFLKKFLNNELNGLRAILESHQKAWVNFFSQEYEKQEITEETQPHLHKIVEKVSDAAGIYPKKVELVGSEENNSAARIIWSSRIEIGRGNLKDGKQFKWTYSHELGHVKYNKLHSTITTLNQPYRLLLASTTTLYSVALLTYPITGKVLYAANYTLEHAGKFLLAGVIFNALSIRAKEYMADLFAYKHTGILPSIGLKVNDREKRKGVVGNISKISAEVIDYIRSGYPLDQERDLVCKAFGKPAKTSFVEKINSERQQPDISPKQEQGRF